MLTIENVSRKFLPAQRAISSSAVQMWDINLFNLHSVPGTGLSTSYVLPLLTLIFVALGSTIIIPVDEKLRPVAIN